MSLELGNWWTVADKIRSKDKVVQQHTLAPSMSLGNYTLKEVFVLSSEERSLLLQEMDLDLLCKSSFRNMGFIKLVEFSLYLVPRILGCESLTGVKRK
jgi:hypothetical protein